MDIASWAVMAPEAYAAAISPEEWPTTALGEIPQERSKSTSATWIAVQQG